MADLPPDTPFGGSCPPRYEPVRQVFLANFGGDFPELGARFTACLDGQIVLDLWGGHADRERSLPFDDRTVAPVFSTSKALAALMLAWRVARGGIAYDQLATDLWPAFGQAGKDRLTVEQVLSHQAGLSGLRGPLPRDIWLDFDAVCRELEIAEPLWPPGSASGYHPLTFGYLAGQLFRLADGRPLGQALREDVAEPLGLDLWIGLPDAEAHRVCQIQRPSAMPDLNPITEPRRLAFLTPWASFPAKQLQQWRRVESPGANGHATAAALARAMAVLACDGALDGHEILPPGLALEAAAQRIQGPDQVLPYDLSWGAGFLRNQGLGIYGPSTHAFGHSGHGGSCAVADPERRLSFAYVMNRQSPHLIGDPRARRLIDALYGCL
jgi:CubicO group peptidase (beta-lactamase class C family)